MNKGNMEKYKVGAFAQQKGYRTLAYINHDQRPILQQSMGFASPAM